ncbi:MAG: FixH family protein [Chloroflexi bacterium]|nr:FixH family protein [Chloroflexota bacterium]
MRYLSLTMLLLVVILAGCRESAQQTATTADSGVQMRLEVAPDPASVGAAVLLVRLADAEDKPITDAVVAVRGDMNHAGMVPVDGAGEPTDVEGEYTVPFQWTMGGDWIVTVTATLADGTIVEQQFPFSVTAQ